MAFTTKSWSNDLDENWWYPHDRGTSLNWGDQWWSSYSSLSESKMAMGHPWTIHGNIILSKSIYIPYSKPSNFQASPRGAVPPELSPRGSAGSDTRGCLPPRRVVSLATLEAPPGCVRWDDQWSTIHWGTMAPMCINFGKDHVVSGPTLFSRIFVLPQLSGIPHATARGQ